MTIAEAQKSHEVMMKKQGTSCAKSLGRKRFQQDLKERPNRDLNIDT
ncbi:MAG: hypothetical protein R3C28_26200 [Pirellulaceae bacterium]